MVTRHGFTLALLALISALGATTLYADTGYVTDQLEITLRAGAGTRFKILRMLTSGTPLEILSTDARTGYARVRTEDGTTGFVLERQLQAEPVARTQVAEMTQRLDALMKEPDSLAKTLTSLQAEHQTLVQTAATLETDNQRLTQELADLRQASANVVEITEAYQRLQTETDKLTQERDDLLQENQSITNAEHQRWFMIGGGVMAGGILLGIILPHLRTRRRKSAWNAI
ncbi:TIGR04211 family SH3 domain-containing protein [Thiocystis violacea]|uniref:TIGR04211 family SH3 domain-containing protein n=1 Tax=Thiocystis violacea TaxID=13725 RepID=UPI0019044E21|nr:TIGR04211 family SH3 domain-containing protein [Thiocystis violacea]MBK1722513.1 hypothetical protein [Thiocystis violacea]